GAVVPPLLLPFIFGTWLVLAVVRRSAGPLVLDPHIWAAVDAIRKSRAAQRPVVVLTGAGTSTASGIPDYLSGAWLDKDIPVSTYSYERFLDSARCRRLYWEACKKFREVAKKAIPNRGHRALAALERSGWLAVTITQNVDGLHQRAGAGEVIELHGRIDRVRCLSCAESGAWPPAGAWRKFDLCCVSCGGYLKPAVIAMGENIPPAAWERSQQTAKDCGVLLVIGSQMAITSAAELLAKARDYGAQIVFLNVGPRAIRYLPGDLYLEHRFEDALPAIARLLDCPPEPKAVSQNPASDEAGEILQEAAAVANEDSTLSVS
ncbi:MAG: SIR2 family NAD-dependent protein deacylase, partial [Alphaproteobacteria bacterium]